MLDHEITTLENEEVGANETEEEAQPANEVVNALAALIDLPRIPQQARGREKRQRIIEAALRLFANGGYESTGIDDIAAAASVSVGTFYGYFRNKQQVFLAYCLEQVGEKLALARTVRMDFSQARPREVIHQAVDTSVGSFDQLQIYRIWLDMVIHDPELAPLERTIFKYIVAEVEESLRYIVAQSRAWPNLDVEVTALSIVLLLDNVNLRYKTPLDRERLVEGLTDIIYRMVFPPEES